jgi:hypothetical protein
MLSECESGKHEDDLKRSEEFMISATFLINSFQSHHLQGISRDLFAAATESS